MIKHDDGVFLAMFQSSAIMQLAYVGIKIGSFGSYFIG